MTDRARRWGIIPAYVDWHGREAEISAATEQSILDSLGAGEGVGPPRAARPNRATRPCAPAPERAWGWSVQLYALRSRSSWGIGDLADLRRWARFAARAGARVLLLNPLAAQNPVQPYQASPYYASSRRFLNLAYLRVEEVAGARLVAPRLESLRAKALRLNRRRLIDYPEVFRLKLDALEAIHAAAPRPRGLVAWKRQQGKELQTFALFSALCEKYGAAWRGWPVPFRHPASAQRQFQSSGFARRVFFHVWIQFHVDHQLARAGEAIGLIQDVPIGFASDGYDAWRWQDVIAPHIRVGVPPDEMFRDGQDWGVPAFDPWKTRHRKGEAFADAVRAATRHSAGVRLDHVMGLFRLFWIPDGMRAAQGAYVRQPTDVLLDRLSAQSGQSRCFVVGEDLGLVEAAVRRRLKLAGALSYRLLWFENRDPKRWIEDSVGAVTTHDLPTIAGLWKLTDPEPRLHHLRRRLVDTTGLTDDASIIDVAVKTYSVLAGGRSRLVLASLDDALGVEERPNVPGTTAADRPNWCIALPVPLEEIESAGGVRRIARAMRASGR